jgi:hypothetical protein
MNSVIKFKNKGCSIFLPPLFYRGKKGDLLSNFINFNLQLV